MKKIIQQNKTGFFKKKFIQLCRLIGYEIIDQSNFYLPVQDKTVEETINNPGLTSINIPLGKINIKRKVSDLTIIVRSYTFAENAKSKFLLDQNKKRIFEEEKIEYTLRTINSVINSCNSATPAWMPHDNI